MFRSICLRSEKYIRALSCLDFILATRFPSTRSSLEKLTMSHTSISRTLCELRGLRPRPAKGSFSSSCQHLKLVTTCGAPTSSQHDENERYCGDMHIERLIELISHRLQHRGRPYGSIGILQLRLRIRDFCDINRPAWVLYVLRA